MTKPQIAQPQQASEIFLKGDYKSLKEYYESTMTKNCQRVQDGARKFKETLAQFKHATTSLTDVLAANRLQIDGNKLANIADLLSDGLVVFSNDGTIELINPIAQSLFGIDSVMDNVNFNDILKLDVVDVANIPGPHTVCHGGKCLTVTLSYVNNDSKSKIAAVVRDESKHGDMHDLTSDAYCIVSRENVLINASNKYVNYLQADVSEIEGRHCEICVNVDDNYLPLSSLSTFAPWRGQVLDKVHGTHVYNASILPIKNGQTVPVYYIIFVKS